MLLINKWFLVLLFMASIWGIGFWMGEQCYTHDGTCYASFARDILDKEIK